MKIAQLSFSLLSLYCQNLNHVFSSIRAICQRAGSLSYGILTLILHSPSEHSGESHKSQHFPSQPWDKSKFLRYIACPQAMLYFLVSALAAVCRFLSTSLYHSPVPLLMKAAHESSVSAIERLDLRIVCLHRKNVDWAVVTKSSELLLGEKMKC